MSVSNQNNKNNKNQAPQKQSSTPVKAGPAAQAKTPSKPAGKKLKSKKLEERIAPGMVGSGIVDPGMVDSAQPTDTSGTGPSYSQMETSLSPESTDTTSTNESGGQYLENTNPSFNQEGYSEPSAGEGAPILDASAHDTSAFENSDLAPSGDYVVEHDSWKEPDWVTSNADGSVTVQPPAGVSIDGGIANFPMSVANDALPIPEEITLKADGSVDVAMAEGTAFNAETGQLTIPAGDAQPHDVPEAFTPVVNPDGSMTLTLPLGQAEYNEDTNTLNLSNAVVNEIAPSYMEVNMDGSVGITLPEGTQFAADGSFTIPAESAHFMDSPPPEYVMETEFASYEADGAVTFDLPQGASVEDGIAEFPYAVATAELPIPDDVVLNNDGTINVELPEGASYLADSNAINFPADHFNPNDVPEGICAYPNADGTWTVPLPDGMNYEADSNTVHMSNYWANEIAPDPIQINTDGSVQVELPHTTEYHADGSFTVPAAQADWVEQQTPSYVHDAPYAEPVGDGSYVVTPPEGVQIQETAYGTQMQIPYEAVAENVPMPHDAEILPDGGIKVEVPQGTTYDANFNCLTLPEGSVNMAEFPEGFPAHVNPDGSMSVTLPQGMAYNDGAVTMNNYWANEFTPPAVEFTAEGSVHVTLPPTVDYQPDGSFVVPTESAEFLATPDPAYTVGGPEWVTPNVDGSVMFTPPTDIQVDPAQGTMTMNFEQVETHFANELPPDMTIHPDGSVETPVPPGTTFDANAGVLTIPAGELAPQEIPAGIIYNVLDSGAVAITLPPGIEYDPATQAVTFDNHWANEIAPPCVTIMADGNVQVDLPPQTQYFDNGGFTVPPAYADFMDNPPPAYVYNGPEWVNMTPDGAVHFTPPPEIHMDPNQGTMTMPYGAAMDHFENHVPENMHLNPDGTMNITVPNYVTYDAASGVLTFPADHAAEHMPPPQVMPYFDEGGNVCVKLPPGIEFDAATNTVHLDNAWTNELSPQNMEISPSGNIQVNMPPGTYYHDGGCSLPPDQANFMNEPYPTYTHDVPDYMAVNTDGSIAITPPANMTLDADAGTVSMSMETFRTELHMDGEMRFNNDGTGDVSLPPNTAYDAANNTLNFPVGAAQLHEIPPQVNPIVNPDGSISVKLPDGITFNAADNTVHLNNQWLNELVPQPVEFHTDGTVSIQLPSDTQYFDNGSFVISAQNADFMDQGGHHQQSGEPIQYQSNGTGQYPPPQYSGQYPYPEYQSQYPQYQPSTGGYTMPATPTNTAA